MKRLVCVGLVVLTIGCSRPSAPADVLTKEKLASVLVEVYLAEAHAESVPLIHDSTIKYYLPQEYAIMKRFGVSDSTIKKTYQYYYSHPKELEEVYDRVIDSLTLREQKMYRTNYGGPTPSSTLKPTQ